MRSTQFLHRLLVIIGAAVSIPMLSLSQNVGIGTSTPAYKLDVRNGSINTDSVYRIQGLKVLSIISYNTIVGREAGDNITGDFNTVLGYRALNKNISGSYNTASGMNAMEKNTSGSNNSAYGFYALRENTIGSFNTANGVQALNFNTAGNSNSAMGFSSLVYNTTGSYNTGSGTESLRMNTTGNYNSALGYWALRENTDGSYNTASGVEALRNNTVGEMNAAYGYLAMFSNATGIQSVAVGSNAMFSNVTGGGNVAIGYQALSNNKDNFNTAIGWRADVNPGTLRETIAIGAGTIVTADYTARFGHIAYVSYGGWAGWTNVSDGRFKKNIKENVPGLEFINKLRPVTYNLDAGRLDKFYRKNMANKSPVSKEHEALFERGIKAKEKIVYTGFVAQEVEAAAKQLGFDFSGVDAAKNENDTYGLRYAEFVVPLVKAVQEQQTMIEALKKQNELLQQRIDQLENKK